MKWVGSRPVQTLRRTPLYERHAALGARLVPFAGWEMPVQYTSISEEHRAVRTRAGVFDVSHMGQLRLAGDGAHEYLQRRLSNDLDRIDPGHAQYTLLTNEEGGIVDDLIAYRRGGDDYLLIVNASNVEVDHAALPETDDVSSEWALLAVQGPEALDRLEVCYPLHGNDITPERTPLEAGLGWACALDKEFTGVDVLRRQKEEGPPKKLVAFVMEDPGIPRKGMPVEEGGEVTSGTLSPTLGKSIGLAYVSASRSDPGTEITIDVRGRPRGARIVKKPFYTREEP